MLPTSMAFPTMSAPAESGRGRGWGVRPRTVRVRSLVFGGPRRYAAQASCRYLALPCRTGPTLARVTNDQGGSPWTRGDGFAEGVRGDPTTTVPRRSETVAHQARSWRSRPRCQRRLNLDPLAWN